MSKKIFHQSNMNNWGPSFWNTLHIIAYQTTKDVNGFLSLVKQIVEKLPCESCVKDGLLYIKNHPLKKYPLSPNGDDLSPFIWMCNFHNYVNKKLNKPEISWTDTYKKFQTQPCERCNQEASKTVQTNKFNSSTESIQRNNTLLYESNQEYEITFISNKNVQLAQRLNEKIKQ